MLLAAVISFTGAVLGCPPEAAAPPITPIADDYTVSGERTQTLGPSGILPLQVTHKAGKSKGAVTVYYEGMDVAYPKNISVPNMRGFFAVTFDVAASGNYGAVKGLSAGGLLILDPELLPLSASDFIVEGAGDRDFTGQAVVVTVKPKTTDITGRITVYYTRTGTNVASEAAPSAFGAYTITFDVAQAGKYNGASGLSAGTLNIRDPGLKTPVLGDYDLGSLSFTYDGNTKPVTVQRKANASMGAVTVLYSGMQNPPSNAGSYPLTLMVQASGEWNATNSIAAGTLTIAARTATADDFSYVINSPQNLGYVLPNAVNIIAKPPLSQPLSITRYYTDYLGVVASDPSNLEEGRYTLSFAVGAGGNWAATPAAQPLAIPAPNNTLDILASAGRTTPAIGDYNFDHSAMQQVFPVTRRPTVTIRDPVEIRSPGQPVVVFDDGTQTWTTQWNEIQQNPSNTKYYGVAISVPAASRGEGDDRVEWSKAFFYIGRIEYVTATTPILSHYVVSGLGSFIYDGTDRAVTISGTPGASGGARTITYTPTLASADTSISTNVPNTNAPRSANTYAVNMNVAASGAWSAATIYVGQIEIRRRAPSASDFSMYDLSKATTANPTGTLVADFSTVFQPENNPKGVRFVPKTTGSMTPVNNDQVVLYNGQPNLPTTEGKYAVTLGLRATDVYGIATNWATVGTPTTGTAAFTNGGFLMGYVELTKVAAKFSVNRLTFGTGSDMVDVPITYNIGSGTQTPIPVIPFDPVRFGDQNIASALRKTITPKVGVMLGSVQLVEQPEPTGTNSPNIATNGHYYVKFEFNDKVSELSGEGTNKDQPKNVKVTIVGLKTPPGVMVQGTTFDYTGVENLYIAEFTIGRAANKGFEYNWEKKLDDLVQNSSDGSLMTEQYIAFPVNYPVKFVQSDSSKSAYTALHWRLNGTTVQSGGGEYTFKANYTGQSTVVLVAKNNADGKIYTATFYITVLANAVPTP